MKRWWRHTESYPNCTQEAKRNSSIYFKKNINMTYPTAKGNIGKACCWCVYTHGSVPMDSWKKEKLHQSLVRRKFSQKPCIAWWSLGHCVRNSPSRTSQNAPTPTIDSRAWWLCEKSRARRAVAASLVPVWIFFKSGFGLRFVTPHSSHFIVKRKQSF